MDNRNYNVTNKVFEVLNNVKGFDVAMSNPRAGVIIMKYEGVNFFVNIDPIFNDNEEGKIAEDTPFEDVVKFHSWVFK